jgi:tetracycline 7-halogenase / FADH2 O2-dependent halogenase
MIELDADVAVIGAGFSGSLMALLLKQIGLTSVLIDRGSHPRFAIGESSTPLANLILEDLARRYDLPRLAPLSNYASWKRAYPDIVCGLKRGFSYFHHALGEDFQPRSDHSNELLVAASSTAEDADTHWLRSDFDQFLADETIAAGIPYFDQTSIHELLPRGDGWELHCNRVSSSSSSGEPGAVRPRVPDGNQEPGALRHPARQDLDADSHESINIRASFLIDASGEGCFLAKQFGIGPHPVGLKTRSRALFSHFTNVARWEDLYTARGGLAGNHPYPCDDAALHHVFEGGWMWVLRFDNGVTSAGFALDPDRFPLDRSVSPEAEWEAMMQRLPAVAEQYAHVEAVVPFRQTGRMQRRLARSAGSNWVMLPNTAAFLDPLHSTGNAFTLVGIERLLGILERNWRRPQLAEDLKRYDEIVQTEVEFLDAIVSGSFAGFHEFERMVALSMFYFATATWSEGERRAGRAVRGSAFLSADHPELKAALARAARDVGDRSISTAAFTARVHAAIAPFNRVGLFDPAKRNLYRHEP